MLALKHCYFAWCYLYTLKIRGAGAGTLQRLDVIHSWSLSIRTRTILARTAKTRRHASPHVLQMRSLRCQFRKRSSSHIQCYKSAAALLVLLNNETNTILRYFERVASSLCRQGAWPFGKWYIAVAAGLRHPGGTLETQTYKHH